MIYKISPNPSFTKRGNPLKFQKNPVLFLILIGLLAGLVVIGNRIYFESKNNVVDILIKYEDWKNKERLFDSGATAISIPLDTLKGLQDEGRIAVLSRAEIIPLSVGFLSHEAESLAEGLVEAEADNLHKTYVFSKDEKLLSRIKNIINEKFQCTYNQKNTISYLEIDADKNEIFEFGIGFDPEKIKNLRKIGFKKIVLVFKSDDIIDTDELWIKLIFESVDNWNDIYGILFEGNAVIGFRTGNSVPVLKTLLKQTNVKIFDVEFTRVKGMEVFQKELTNRIVRVHLIEGNKLKSISFEMAVYRFRRAVIERNIRAIYFQPFVSSLEENIKFIKRIKNELETKGYKFYNRPLRDLQQSQQSINYFNVPVIITFLIAVGIICTFSLLLNTSLISISIFLVAFVMILILLIFNQTIFVQKFVSLLGALFLPVVSISFFKFDTLHTYKDKLSDYFWLCYDSFIQFMKITLITLAGSILISSLLSTEIFIKAIACFTGVKLAYLLPLVLIMFYLYIKDKKKIDLILDKNLKVRHIISTSIFLMILVVFLIFYISRTGNFPSMIIFSEDKIRIFLENTLIARPRLKEFLIGHPLLLLGIAMNYIANKERIKLTGFILITFGMIGQISIINTFCHIHTPFIFNVLRTLNGVLIGSLIGSILILILKFINEFRDSKK